MHMNNEQDQIQNGFDGARFINILLLVIFISLLLFGSSNIQNPPLLDPVI